MMKKLSLLLAIIMMFTCIGAFAEGEGPSEGAPAEEASEPIGANQVMDVRASEVDEEAAAAEEAAEAEESAETAETSEAESDSEENKGDEE